MLVKEVLAHKLHAKILDLRIMALNLGENTKQALESAEILSQNLGMKYMHQFRKLERLAMKLNLLNNHQHI